MTTEATTRLKERMARLGWKRADDDTWTYDPLADWTQDEIDSLLGPSLLQRWRDSEAPTRRSLARMVEEAVACDPYLLESRERELEELADDATDDVCEREELLGWLRESALWAPDGDGAIERRSHVLADVILNDNEEWNSDYTNVNALAWAAADEDEVSDEHLDEVLANNGLSLLAEKLGLRRDCMLDEDAEGPAKALRDELESTSCYGAPVLAVFCRMPFTDYVDAIEAMSDDDAESVTLRLAPKPLPRQRPSLLAGLFDPWNGAGGELGLEVEETLELKASEIADVALEFWNRGETFVSRFSGYAMSSVYGTDESPWRPGSLTTVTPEGETRDVA